MKREGHTALVHTAAASNLGQMLNKICIADGIAMVNVMSKESQAELARSIGATHIVNSSLDSFTSDLHSALIETGATLGFDTIGGGELASHLLAGMEAALSDGYQYSNYGSATHKQVYIYGGLGQSITTLNRNFGMS